jgi:hypothetical protein
LSTTASISVKRSLASAARHACGQRGPVGDAHAVPAVRAGDGDQVGGGKVDAEVAETHPPLLQLDQRERAVGEADDRERQPEVAQRRQLTDGHLEAAIAGEAHDGAVGPRQLGPDRRRQAIAHRGEARRLEQPYGS